MKCSKCHDKIPKGKEKYHEKKILCKWCWDNYTQKKQQKGVMFPGLKEIKRNGGKSK